ncbi:hypothetical protein [Hydrogenophilus thiooxidans]|uniref:hypothetical protein n=1 Tax=Hydrogenophilus thiooxidans TaxID=2820326 RepID=UPI001C24C300|nr:hypothetical protein [Hydrogenophilus thiooxidans]
MSLVDNGTRRVIDGVERVYYDGYWVKTYPIPENELWARKTLIHDLTRRLFNHVEHGLNVPGKRLQEARAAYERETDPQKKRVKGAMLAGALFNRATDIFTHLVELQEQGVQISSSNELMRECGNCLREALALGRLVLHRSGEEGIDELWGEPFRAFSVPIADFYETRYLKIAWTMRDIDRIVDTMVRTIGTHPFFQGLTAHLHRLATAAKVKVETLRTDPEIFEVWSEFVVASENVLHYKPRLNHPPSRDELLLIADGERLVRDGQALISYITRARTPMPKSTAHYLERCAHFASGQLQITTHHLMVGDRATTLPPHVAALQATQEAPAASGSPVGSPSAVDHTTA